VPLAKAADIELVEALESYLEWQSDAAYKANPPSNYFFNPYDMFATLGRIKNGLKADRYSNEPGFQEDLYLNVFSAGHDGHSAFLPDALTRVFSWKLQRSLVSVTEDGVSSPVIKIYEDMLFAPKTASVVKLINGIDAATYNAGTIYTATYNNITTTNTTFGLGINLTASPPTPQPFFPSNTILLYDGVCASTCALTSTMFRQQAHIKIHRPRRPPLPHRSYPRRRRH
jgi:hypothetical protein